MSFLKIYWDLVSQLRPAQVDALPVINWLIDSSPNSRRTGRTTLLALAFVRAAITNPGRKIMIFDHIKFDRPYGRNHYVKEKIIEITQGNLEIRNSLDIEEDFIRLNPVPGFHFGVTTNLLHEANIHEKSLDIILGEAVAAVEAVVRIGVPIDKVLEAIKIRFVKMTMEE